MINVKHYTELFFNKESGKERYSLIPKEAENIYKNNSLEKSWEIAIECYENELYYMQMLGVYIIGLIGNKESLDFLKNTVSKNPSWQVQEFMAMAFDNYCKKNGYEKSLDTINEWLKNEHENVRRAVTEGLRNWIKRPYFNDNPHIAIKILSKHKTDKSEYVRKSVGNALKDISKTYPDLIKEELDGWKLDTKEIEKVHKLASKFIK
ncbi:MAG: DNA alkylation repair protein [Campylobacteraceae bacterium]|jgi:3-methyladenine DNA glycosylase AlkC|nr:DNA alkylation repair protein [Campylobacteraceae bacterium]